MSNITTFIFTLFILFYDSYKRTFIGFPMFIVCFSSFINSRFTALM